MTKPATQIERVVLATIIVGSLNSQEAEQRPIRARHLNSVVSDLAHIHGLEFERVREKHRGYMGEPCYLIRYSIVESSKPKAKTLVDLWRSKRNAQPIDWGNVTKTQLQNVILS